MTDYRNGYEYYKKACKEYGLDPVNFHYFTIKLSHEQLEAYNERAERGRGKNIEN